MLNTIFSKEQRMTTVWKENIVQGSLFLRSELERTKTSTEPRNQLKGHRPPAHSHLLCAHKSFRILLRSRVGYTLPEIKKVTIGRKNQKEGKKKMWIKEMWFLFHFQSFKDIYSSFGYKEVIITAVNVMSI